jgi:hypothetical protein
LIVCICCCVIQGAKASNANVAVEGIFMRKLCQCKDDLLAGRKIVLMTLTPGSLDLVVGLKDKK